MDLHAQVVDDLDLGLEDVPGQAVLGDAEGEPAAGDRGLLVDRDIVAFDRQVVGAVRPAGPAPTTATFLPFFSLISGT